MRECMCVSICCRRVFYEMNWIEWTLLHVSKFFSCILCKHIGVLSAGLTATMCFKFLFWAFWNVIFVFMAS